MFTFWKKKKKSEKVTKKYRKWNKGCVLTEKNGQGSLKSENCAHKQG